MKDLGENDFLGHITGVTQQMMSHAQNWPFSLQVQFALATLLDGTTTLMRM